ncbi:type VII secretion integral membrane protein EccD [Micromonospora sp. DR5-3]|uniref:type VII secretion integral membrane protein EccD n=1 Tax=unclassified Micromonospora TaxID=2617518 RepID=UPI0011DC53AE|nr:MULTISPECIES: type VII secretion integral membrane protein EccD [unclassified Micromonospora]MCW3815933.1 type VII secretion integral membrane protein EccD [Micromonospora sp. DR5-3]TYC24430.1 type VII secretion integral membrane protein EccD [Micromonospora sp. MP36]
MTTAVAPRRVTVVAPHARLDVSLPAQSTVAELLPQLVRLLATEADRAGGAGWELRRLGGSPLDGSVTVTGAGVRDGEVLYLGTVDRRATPMLFDDVVDAIASAAADRPGVWRAAISRKVGGAVAALAFTAVAVAVGWSGLAAPTVALLAGVLALALLIAGGALSRAFGDRGLGAAVAAAGVPATMIAGAAAAGGLDPATGLTAGRLALAGAAGTLYTMLAAAAVAEQRFVAAAMATTVGSLGALAALLTTAPPAAIAAVTCCAAVMASPVLPTLALRLGRLPLPGVPTDVEAFRRDERPTLGPEVVGDTEQAERILTGLLWGLAVIVACCAAALLLVGGRWAWALAGLVGAALLLRARAYVGLGQRAALLLAGAGSVLGLAVRASLAGGPGTRLLAAALLLVTGVVCATYAVRAPAGAPSPYWGRLLDVVEFLALVSLVPVAAAVLDIYGAVRAWGG